MRTRLFLRTAEFLWQEGHTAHATKEEAVAETVQMLDIYAKFVEEYMALPVIKGVKTASERFAGAEDTYCIEAMMQDGKALQAGTSHFLGQNFAKAFDVKFAAKDNTMEYVWATSWGVSTRLIGALVMAHSDDEGLVIPPRIAPLHVVIVPIYGKDAEARQKIDDKAADIITQLKAKGIRVKYDNDDANRPGWKFAEYELRGIPVRIALGARDLENNLAEVARRDEKTKESVALDNIVSHVSQLLEDIQSNLYNKALAFRTQNMRKADNWDEFVKMLDETPGFISAHWDGTAETEDKIKELSKATIRCIPLNNEQEAGACILTSKPSTQRVLFARAY
jgi:prolyl-tRNA synthetase